MDSKHDNLYRINDSCMRWCTYEINLFGDPTVAIRGGAPLQLSIPDGPPATCAPGEELAIVVRIEELEGAYLEGSGLLHYRSAPISSFTPLALTSLGGDLYQATIPAMECSDAPDFYITAESVGGTQVSLPSSAPSDWFDVFIGAVEVVIDDDFETSTGWTAENLGATSGDWQRGVPVNDPNWDYDPASDSDGSGRCYLTQNEYDNTDVDDGAVRLTSPVMDFTGGDVVIHYDYFLRLTRPEEGTDMLLVEISSNGDAGPWTEIARHDTDGGLNWRSHEITDGDLAAAGVLITANMKMRFTANDADSQSIVEAGVDAFSVSCFTCEDPGDPCPWDFDGSLSVGIGDLNALLSNWGASCPGAGCPFDFDGSGSVGLGDLNAMLSNWGPCP
jgi:hypothetical protein